MIRIYILVAYLTLIFITASPQDFMINEVMTSNASSILDETYYNYSEWIEIHNPSSMSKDIGGYYLSKDINNLLMWQIPSGSIPANGFKIIWCDKMNQGFHSSFRARTNRELILLSNANGTIIDSVRIEFPFRNCSYGRHPDKSPNWHYFMLSTPGSSNNSSVVCTQAPEPEFSLTAGRYSDPQSLILSLPVPGYTIRYTTDGSEPTESSTPYEHAINISKTTTVKAKAFAPEMVPGNVVANTYFINEHPFTIPVVSLSMDPKYLWDDVIGILTDGTNGVIGNCTTEPKNWNQNWERYAYIEFFRPDGSRFIHTGAGAKIAGGCSRRNELKSFGVSFRDKYGADNIRYPLFQSKQTDRFTSLMFRNSGNDFNLTMFLDAMIQSLLIGEMDVDCNAYTPSAFYLNGDYWGILNTREKINEGYIYSNYGLDEDSIDFLENNQLIIEGSNADYNTLMDYINTNDLSQSIHYQYIKDKIDINEYINYLIAEIYSDNRDWPGSNLRYWKPKRTGGKWRWIIFDMDFGFARYYNNTLLLALATDGLSWPNPPWSTLLFRKLLENDEFKNRFLDKFNIYIYSTFNPIRINRIIDTLRQNIADEIPYHFTRWNGSLSDWDDNISIMRTFADKRQSYMMTHLKDYFLLEPPYDLRISSTSHQINFVSLNDIVIHDTIFEGKYFGNRYIKIKALPYKNLRFKQWKLKYANSDKIEIHAEPEIILKINTGLECIAEFDTGSLIQDLFINEICAKNTLFPDEASEFDDWIELYNAGNDTIDLAGLYLTDSLEEPTMFMIPDIISSETKISPRSYKLLWADGQPEQGVLHVDFKLNKESGQIGLVQLTTENIHYIDSLSYGAQKTNYSLGRYPDGTGKWLKIANMTPGQSNVSGCATIPYKNLFINEICAKNTLFPDNASEFDDWIELYNSGYDTINLAGLYLTDDFYLPALFMIPDTQSSEILIPPYSFKLLWADEQLEQGLQHLDFKLDKDGGQIGIAQLTTDGIQYIDSLSYAAQKTNHSFGRYPDGTIEWLEMVTMTPRESNIYIHDTMDTNDTVITINKNDTIRYLYINEICIENSILPDENSEFDNWIELYNASNNIINLAGLYFSDDFKAPALFMIPDSVSQETKILPGSYKILWADGQPEQGLLHLDFELDKNGGHLSLAQPINGENIRFIDAASYPAQEENCSRGRYPDGNRQWFQMTNITPGKSNIHNGITKVNDLGHGCPEFYPNPADARINVVFEKAIIKPTIIIFYSILGKKIMQVPVETGTIHKSIDISMLDKGMYFVTIHNEISIHTIKLIKN
ncbi:MAG: lamin tail domain-containing protein [Bacteroidales bacterium]|nr:lamin tail domain-containing protein [Bacteroidales bacterium]